MTRFARGGPANKKKPHEATEWKNMVDHQAHKQEKAKRKRENLLNSCKTVSKPKHRQKKSKIKPKLLGKVGLDSKTTSNEDTLSFLTGSSSSSGGLAAELEKLKNSNMEVEVGKKVCVSKSNKVQKQGRWHTNAGDNNNYSCNKKLKVKGEKLIKTELTEYLTSLKRDKILNKSEEKEVQELLKKDQRREKRRLKRIDKKADGRICFHCSQSGHAMSDCPGKAAQQQGTGICFKCGSTEHTMNKCKVRLPAGKYPYAKCFICGEQGHLSNQCPDNPRGLYPNGGCCGTCGSVEHFKKDCPELQKEQGIASFAIERMTSSFDNVERDPSLEPKICIGNKKPKVVKF